MCVDMAKRAVGIGGVRCEFLVRFFYTHVAFVGMPTFLLFNPMSAPVTRLPHMSVFELVLDGEGLMWHYLMAFMH